MNIEPLDYPRYRNALDQATLDRFFNGDKFDNDDLVNVVNGLDLLQEITTTTYFKTGRYLETPDTYIRKPEVHRAFNLKKDSTGRSPNKIKKVGYPTNHLIQEFFEGGYFGLFYRLMYQLRENRLNFTLDGEHGTKCIVRLDPVPPHPSFGVIEYVNVTQKITLKLPFFLSRLGKDHMMVKTGT